jgi:hypothetical protein
MFKPDRQTSIPTFDRIDLLDAADRDQLIHMIDFAKTFRRGHEALYQLHAKGPVWDGDVVSKNDRDVLLDVGACEKVCVAGKQGYNACTYNGRSLLRIYDWLYGPINADPVR